MSVSVCLSVCVCVGVCGVWSCVVCVVECGVVFVVVWHAENLRVCIQHVPVCAFKTFPCVPATCPHVLYMWACCRYTRGHFERTHGDVLNAHTEGRRGGRRGEEGRGGSSPVLLTKMAHVALSLDPREVHQKQPLDLTHLRFKSRSRTTCHRFLQSFAISGTGVPLQLS